MNEKKVNSDLLLCENDLYLKENTINSLLITKSAQKNAINCQIKPNSVKTERISSNVLSRAKDFLAKTKTNESIGEKCDLISSESNDCPNDCKPVIEMNLLLFENKRPKSESSDEDIEDNDSNESSDESSEDSEEESDCNESDNKERNENKE